MDVESPPVFEQLTIRLSILHDLVDALLKAQSAIALSDLQNMELHIAQQRRLCHALMDLGTLSPQPSVAPVLRWNKLVLELKETEHYALHLGRVQSALLRRTRRGLDLFSRLLASTALTYTPSMIAPGMGR